MTKFFWTLILLPVWLTSCSGEKENIYPEQGKWKGQLDLQGEILPFIFEIARADTGFIFTLINGEERLETRELNIKGDSFRVALPVFDSYFVGIVETPQKLKGTWINNGRETDNKIDFTAEHGIEIRFETVATPGFNVTGKWDAGFYNQQKNSAEFTVKRAVGVFEQSGSYVTGTFLSPTGDYRHLEGIVDGRTLKLSTFDGAHAYLFIAEFRNDRLEGQFWSGIHHKSKWMAERNDGVGLPNADTLTKATDAPVAFSFPDTEGNMVSLDDDRYKNKVVLVQVMGSWCPNCMDETAYLTELYRTHKDDGLEVIALGFERSADPEKARAALHRLKSHYNAEYPFLIAGTATKEDASKKLPFLDEVRAFPTLIFIDKKGNIAGIHTGFSGPATGYYHRKFREETETKLGKLLG